MGRKMEGKEKGEGTDRKDVKVGKRKRIGT